MSSDQKISDSGKAIKKGAIAPVLGMAHVEKQFYEFQLEDLEKQLGRLRVRCSELETQFEQSTLEYEKLDREMKDTRGYHKKTLQKKDDEIAELNERIIALDKDSEATIAKLKSDMNEMKEESRQTENRMMAEINLLNGKLSSLEEFRLEREELYNKFEVQEQSIAEQETNYNRMIYELEKTHLMNKNLLRKEMENKLVDLSTDFQKTTKSHIAVSTQNLIRENIALNNELFILIGAWQEIYQENEKVKHKFKELSLNKQINDGQLKKALSKNAIQAEILQKLANEHSKITDYYEEFQQNKLIIETLRKMVDELKDQNRKAVFDVQTLKQEKHYLGTLVNHHIMNVNKVQCHNSKLEKLIHKVKVLVQENLGLDEMKRSKSEEFDPVEVFGEDEQEAINYGKRQSLLSTILELLSEDFLLISVPARDESIATFES